MKTKIAFLISYLLIFQLNLFPQSTEGKKFWVGFLQNLIDTSANNPSLHLYLSSRYSTKGRIYFNLENKILDFSLKKDSGFTVKVPLDYMPSSSEEIEKRSIFIESEKEINVFALNYNKYTSDATIIYPEPALDREYICVGYNNLAINELLIIAIKDRTKVEIFPSCKTFGGRTTSFTITLNKGETYHIKFLGDVTGTIVKSLNHPIAVYSGVQCTFVPPNYPYCDHLFEQVPPTSSLGKTYYTIPLKTRKGDTYRVVATRDNTSLFINDNKVTILNKGQFFDTIISKPSIFRGNYPFLLAQYSNGQNFDTTISDPFMIIISPINQTRNKIKFNAFKSEIIENYYLNILIKSKDVKTIVLDSNTISLSYFHKYDFDKDYSFAQINISQGEHTLKSSGGGFIAYIYGYGNYESFGYVAGTRLENLNFKIRFGLFSSLTYKKEKTNFLNFQAIPTCYRNLFEICDKKFFNSSNLTKYSTGLLLEIPTFLNTPFGFGGRVRLEKSNIFFSKDEYAFENTNLQRKLLNTAEINLYSLKLNPYMIFTFIDIVNLYFGLHWTFNLKVSDLYLEKITSSKISNETNFIIYTKSKFYESNYQIFGPSFGFSLDLPLNEDKNIRFFSDASYYHNLISNCKEISLFFNTIELSLGIKFGY